MKGALRGHDYATQVQMLAPGGGERASDVQAAAAEGVSGSGGALPHSDRIQQSFGGYDISNVQAHTDAAAANASASMGATAYASGNHVALGAGGQDLHTVAHEAAHVVQQRAGVQLSGGVGKAGDAYEQHADKVADAVVAGKSAEPILSEMSGGGTGGAVQTKAVQRQVPTTPNTTHTTNTGSTENTQNTTTETTTAENTEASGPTPEEPAKQSFEATRTAAKATTGSATSRLGSVQAALGAGVQRREDTDVTAPAGEQNVRTPEPLEGVAPRPAVIDGALLALLANHAQVGTASESWYVSIETEVVRHLPSTLLPELAAVFLATRVLQRVDVTQAQGAVRQLLARGDIVQLTRVPDDLKTTSQKEITTRFQAGVVEAIAAALHIPYSARGEHGREEIARATALKAVLAQVGRQFGEVEAHLVPVILLMHGVTPAALRATIGSDRGRDLVAIALLDPPYATTPVVRRLTAALDRPTPPSDLVLTGAEWAGLLTTIVPAIHAHVRQVAEQAAKDQAHDEAEAKARANRLSVADPLAFIRDNLKPGASADSGTVLGTLRSGMRLKSGDKQAFILDFRGFDVIYQDETDGGFYRQSTRAFVQGAQLAILADVGARLAPMVDAMITFGMDLMSALLPPTRVPILIIKLLDTTAKVKNHWPQIELAYEFITAAKRELDQRYPGLFGAILDAALAGVTLDFSVSARDFVILAARVFADSAVHAVTGAAGKVIGVLVRSAMGLKAFFEFGVDRAAALQRLAQHVSPQVSAIIERHAGDEQKIQATLETLMAGFEKLRTVIAQLVP